MAETVVETLGKELEALDREYATDFAGHSRLTRDVEQMERMIKRAASVVAQVDRIPAAAQGPDLQRLRDAASTSHTLYKNEREAILRAQATGPAFEQFAAEATAANFVFAKYMRHFAGQDRGTRDTALLGELVEDLRQIEKRMGALVDGDKKNAEFAKDRNIVRENVTQYQKEIELISTAQQTGTPEEQASILATLANNQFAVYQGNFAGEPRISRRPALLMRVVASLKKIRDRMIALRTGGLNVEFNEKNLKIVEDRLEVYETELGEIRKLRQATAMTDIMGELGGAANKLFDEYRAGFADKPRANADVKRLSAICDKLTEIRRQMTELSWAEESDMNTKNLDIVNEQLTLFEAEFEQVVRSQAANATK